MKQTFASQTFASKSFAGGNWAGVGIEATVFPELFVANYARQDGIYQQQAAGRAIAEMPFVALGVLPALVTAFEVDEPSDFQRRADVEGEVYPRQETTIDAL